MIHHEIVGPRHGPECNGGKIGWPAMMFWAADELNDFCAHENPSHTAIATRPANASEIKYAVMMASLRRIQSRLGRRLACRRVLRQCADMGGWCVPNAAAVRYEIFRFKKPAAGFPARAPKKYCDDEDMPVICPTCQIFPWSRCRARAGASTQIPEPGALFLRL
jgi:hypothetical protein